MRFLFLGLTLSLFSLEPRLEPVHLRTSVIIPCYEKHLPYLGHLLEAFSHQTVIPDEVVLSFTTGQVLPSAVQIPDELPFALALAWSDEPDPGSARNAACAISSGDLLICQDADDLPHPQRVEILRHLFEHYPIDILLHRWAPPTTQFFPYTIEESIVRAHLIERYLFEQYAILTVDGQSFDYIHSGSPAFLKKVSEALRWAPMHYGEDVKFNHAAFALFPNKVILDEPLVIYRNALSSYTYRKFRRW
jgi:hypothetical protein